MTDPLDAFRQNKPTARDGWADSQAADHVMRRAMSSQDPVPARHRGRKRRAMVVAAVASVATIGVSAVAYATIFRADNPQQAGCYTRLDPQSDTTEALPDLVDEVGPVEACAETWKQVAGAPSDVSNLVACINESGGRGVFPAPTRMPAEEACASIGWQPEK